MFSGYTGTLLSQSMAGFFHDSKSAVIDNKLRAELVSKSRVLATKVPLASAIINTLTRGVIGSGVHLTENDPLFEMLSATYQFDAMHQQDIYQMQQQAFQTMLLSGECWLIRQEGCAWFICEPDHIFTPPFASVAANGKTVYKGNTIIDGIEYDKTTGNAVAIHYCRDPYSTDVTIKKQWERIPYHDETGARRVIQIHLIERPEYPRGLPILAPLIETLYGLYAYSQAQIQMGILQSCQALVVKTSTNKTLNPFGAMSSADFSAPLVPEDEEEEKRDEPPKEYCITPPNNRDVFGMANNLNYVSAGQTIHLGEDESLECITPTGPSNSLSEYYNLVLEQCCAALGIPKPLLNGVFDTSFSASKASISQWLYTISKYRKAFVEQCLKPMYRAYLEEHSGLSVSDCTRKAVESEWISIDPPMLVDEVRAMTLMKEAFELGLVTRDEIAQQLFGHSAHADESIIAKLLREKEQ